MHSDPSRLGRRLNGRNFTFDENSKNRPFTAKLKSESARQSKLPNAGEWMQTGRAFEWSRPRDPRQLVKTNKNGLSTILSDEELKKRLLNAALNKP